MEKILVPGVSDRIRQIVEALGPYQPDRIYLFGSWVLPRLYPRGVCSHAEGGERFC